MADFSFGHIFHIVSTERGGGPLHFWFEHFLLTWWPGLPALRFPSLAFLILGLVAVALIALRLYGADAAAAVVLLTAASPVPVMYATFGRPHTMLFAWLQWSTLLALVAADRRDRRLWAAAGALLGLSVFVHPTAPLYAWTALAAALAYGWRSPRELVREAWPGAAALLVTFLPYYAATLHVLTDRYGVGIGKSGRTFSGRPVWEDALHFVAPGPHDLNWFSGLALAGVAVLLLRRAYRVLAFCAITVAVPLLFFSFVPTGGVSALFFDRYAIPFIPAFLVVAVVPIVEVARRVGPPGLAVVALAVAGLLVIELHDDLRHRRRLERIGVDAVVRAVEHERPGTVLFGSTGTSGALFSAFDFGHPANVLDHLIELRVPSLVLVDDDACARALPFLRGSQRPRYGLWVFYAASADEAAAARRALRVEPVDGRYFLVRTDTPLPPRALIRRGIELRLAWKRAVPLNVRVDELLKADRELLRGRCVPYGPLGDPDISPHWPPLTSKHQ